MFLEKKKLAVVFERYVPSLRTQHMHLQVVPFAVVGDEPQLVKTIEREFLDSGTRVGAAFEELSPDTTLDQVLTHA